MSKKRKWEFVEKEEFGSQTKFIDWSICILCQTKTSLPLVNPTECGYESLVINLNTFKNLEKLPKSVPFDKYDDGEGILNSFKKNTAKYHKDCRAALNTRMLRRVKLESSSTELQDETIPSSARVPRSSFGHVDVKYSCLFCDCDDISGNLCSVSTSNVGQTMRDLAIELEDSKLLTKLASKDLVAVEAKYHKLCYVRYRTKVRAMKRNNLIPEKYQERLTYGSVLGELVEYIFDCTRNEEVQPVFKLSFLTKLIAQRMTVLGIVKNENDIQRTRLKEDLLAMIPELRAEKCGREVLLAFDRDFGSALKDACEFSNLSDGICLARAAQIVRKELFREFPKFSGCFNKEFGPSGSVPDTLLTLIRMIVDGFDIGSSPPSNDPSTAVSISQLIRYNSVKRIKKEGANLTIRHPISQETPLPLYVGLMIHNHTRSRKIIDKMHSYGICVSYKRVQEISTSVSNKLCADYESLGFVCPPTLLNEVFTTAAIDNIDFNPSSTTAIDSFHGSSVTIIQHPETYPDQVLKFKFDETNVKNKIVGGLPESYSSLPATTLKKQDPPITTICHTRSNISIESHDVIAPWLLEIEKIVKTNTSCDGEDNVSFSAFFSRNEEIKIKSHSQLLPLLKDEIQSPAMVRHMMDIIKSIVSKVNPNQSPVITGDQPVYALLKQIQWKYPEVYGETKFVSMMGALHIEMDTMKAIGKFLSGSGWTEIVTKANMCGSGRAESFLKVSHVKRTRFAHQVTLCTLHILIKEAYQSYIKTCNDNSKEVREFNEWVEERRKDSPQFEYWAIVMELEELLLGLVVSIRKSKFEMYVDMLIQICPWLFAFDLTHYSRWLSVFIKSLQEIPILQPDVYIEFMKGNFTSRRGENVFSSISDDQYHEQNNKLIKGAGGAVGILDNASALLKWMVAGPEVSMMVHDFEELSGFRNDVNTPSKSHHEDTCSFEKRFHKNLVNMTSTFRDEGNPFEEESGLLVTVDGSRVIMNNHSITSLYSLKTKGQEQYQEFVTERLIKGNSIHDVITRNNMLPFSSPSTRIISKDKCKIQALHKDSNMLCKLYVSSQTRDSDVNDFFAHENCSYPPSISEFGKMRKPSCKSSIVGCIESKVGHLNSDTTKEPLVSCLIIDGAALVHMLPPGSVNTFGEYSFDVFNKFIKHRLSRTERIDIVFDRYFADSLKSATRESRGSGQTISITQQTKLPRLFNKFLAVDFNKEQLFRILSKNVVLIELPGKEVVATHDDKVLTSPLRSLDEISPCSHEEADTRILLHVKDAVSRGHKKITIKTVDSDIVVIAISVFDQLQGIDELWIEYGNGKNKSYLPIHEFTSKLPSETVSSLPFFTAFTGCDTVSGFAGIGKLTAWKVLMSYPAANAAMDYFGHAPSQPWNEDYLKAVIRFAILLYDRSSALVNINECRRVLFTKKDRHVENIPPTEDALHQHIKRASLQAETWRSCLVATPEVLNPMLWGWEKTEASAGKYLPVWITIPHVTNHCKELIICRCRTRCVNCKCSRSGLPCTQLCSCDGHCSRNDL